MTDHPTILFLHIPKTAGQSIHEFLVDLFPKECIAPARVNEQLVQMSILELRKYAVFSGHLDWALLDCVLGPRFAFTVLREPTDRILSFYFFLRRTASALSEAELRLPYNQGLRAALNLSCDEYFTSDVHDLRTYLDNHYDNFYTHFFAGRTYDARQRIVDQKRVDPTFSDRKVLDMALQNLTVLDGVYSIDRLDLLEKDLLRIAGGRVEVTSLAERRDNSGDSGNLIMRMDGLRTLGATAATFNRIRQMTELDREIWSYVQRQIPREPEAQRGSA